jgi:hypothetical protein
MSRYAIGKAAGIDKAVLSRFMAGKAGLMMATLDRLAALLRLRIVPDRKRRARPPGRPAGPPEKRQVTGEHGRRGP